MDKSGNGTFVNGELVGKNKSRLLSHNDKIVILRNKTTQQPELGFIFKDNAHLLFENQHNVIERSVSTPELSVPKINITPPPSPQPKSRRHSLNSHTQQKLQSCADPSQGKKDDPITQCQAAPQLQSESIQEYSTNESEKQSLKRKLLNNPDTSLPSKKRKANETNNDATVLSDSLSNGS